MAARGRPLKALALVAATTFVLHPALCDVLHTSERRPHHAGPSHAHSHARHGHFHHHHHPADSATSGQSPVLREAHHCCGGHDRPAVTLSARVAAAGLATPWSALAWVPVPCLAGVGPGPVGVDFAPLISAPPPAQGTVRALLGCWLI